MQLLIQQISLWIWKSQNLFFIILSDFPGSKVPTAMSLSIKFL